MAELAVSHAIYRQACFHAQQAVEKALKAFLVVKMGTHPKSHSLEQLLLFDQGDELKAWRSQWRRLDQYYLPTRYADALPESAGAVPGAEDAAQAIQDARAIVAEIRRRLGLAG